MPLVTYVPQENGDPITTRFAGFEFRAGEPMEIPETETMMQHVMEEHTNSHGEARNKGVDRKVKVLDVIKTNPYFRVAGEPEPPAVKRAGGRPKTPHNPEEYKAFAMAWFARAESYNDLVDRWEAEKDLREKCAVHDDGEAISYLQKFFDGRYHVLGGPKKKASYSE